jgi:glycosyltransferase involved in cell wall biosynthesis
MTDRRRRILHIVQNLNFGGMERIIAELAIRTDAARFDVHVLALQYLGHFSEGLDAFATLHLANPMPAWSMLSPNSLARQIRDIAPDVVHTHSGVWYKATRAARMAGVPRVIHTDHGRPNPDPWLDRLLDRNASRRTDTIVAVSDALAIQLSKIVVDPQRIQVIRNGVDTEQYQPAPRNVMLHCELGIDPATPIIGSIGRLEAIKGYEVSVAAFAQMLTDWRGAVRPVLALIGDGSQRAALEAQAQQLGVQDAVYFLGWRSDIETCLHAFEFFAMSSHSEGTSISLLEAMSAGLCPIVTDVGGNAAVLGETLAHRLVVRANPQALAAAWCNALSDPAQLRCDAEAARRRIVDAFGLDAMVRRYETLYEA